ncbi:MAG: Mfa1 family fimbria major subunit [Parabacteroides sp.]|nr:Mfa1 family fimbria major subunit [Parabacteroides sp.]
MNTKYIYLLASSVLLLAAGCTDEDGNGKEEPQPGLKRDAYTSVTIKLPTVSGTKAAPAYDPGTKKEYAVKDLTLLFFRTPDGGSANEEDFVLSDVVSTVPGLSTTSGVLAVTLPKDDDTSSDVTKKFTTGAISIDKSSVRALALLNVEKVTGLATTILKIGHSFKMINEAVKLVDISHLSGDQFLMLSAPLWKNGTMSTLTTIEPKTSKEAAEQAPVSIEVERAVAKVSLKASSSSYLDNGSGPCFTVADNFSHKGDKITILGWDLGNTNTYVYPFRKVNTTWFSDLQYATLWGSGAGALVSGSRIHWAEDPNYNEANWDAVTFQTPSSISDETAWADATRYCLENTCDYQYMYKPQVTRVIVKAKYIPNANSQDGGNNTTDDDKTWWSFTSVAAHYSAKNMYLKIMDWMHTQLTGSPDIPTNVDDINLSNENLTASGGNWTINLNGTGSAAHFDLASVSYISNGATTSVDAAIINAFKSGMGQIQKYDKGICYYDIFIRHFTNTEGGYSDDWTNTSGYGVAQLGRYG